MKLYHYCAFRQYPNGDQQWMDGIIRTSVYLGSPEGYASIKGSIKKEMDDNSYSDINPTITSLTLLQDF